MLGRLRRARGGVAAVEFAMAAPVLLVLLLGIYDIGHMVYVSAVLRGAVQQVARDGTLEIANTAKADAFVREIVGRVAPDAVITTTRKSYYDFADINRPESWNDANNNGVCDNGEAYTDENRNGQWDANVGKSGNGSAGDVVLYTVTVTYEPLFPVPFTANSDATRTLSATSVKKNQPYALQAGYGAAARTCN